MEAEGDEVEVGGETVGWISSALLFAFYGALLYYVAVLSPAQTPYRDQYFLEKLVGLRGDDGFVMNTVLVCEFYIMGLWPLIYSSLLIPSGRSERGVPVWPFLAVSFAAGAYGLVPYFGLWQPPPPSVKNEELQRWPLNFLESKILQQFVVLVSGIGLSVAAALAGTDAWTEFFQYFRESKFIHVMSVDFLTLSSLAPFWVYNDMATRKLLDKSLWVLPLSLIPYIGPALYLVLRPPLPSSMLEERLENFLTRNSPH